MEIRRRVEVFKEEFPEGSRFFYISDGLCPGHVVECVVWNFLREEDVLLLLVRENSKGWYTETRIIVDLLNQGIFLSREKAEEETKRRRKAFWSRERHEHMFPKTPHS